jgi:hypothetical protein
LKEKKLVFNPDEVYGGEDYSDDDEEGDEEKGEEEEGEKGEKGEKKVCGLLLACTLGVFSHMLCARLLDDI